jgi:hypothetical protein
LFAKFNDMHNMFPMEIMLDNDNWMDSTRGHPMAII